MEVHKLSMEDDKLDVTRPWADLPPELLSLIADRLGLVEVLGFRGVCKGWRHASSTASAESESAKGLEPSFLLHGAEEKCKFFHQGTNKTYRINIPELDKTICLASDYGWLLLAQNQDQSSLFFFCPFSSTRIELPQFPQSDLSNYVASFSAPPTSPECILVVAHLCNSSKLELHQLHRGASTWNRQELVIPEMRALADAFYHNTKGCFYFVDNDNTVVKYTTKEQQMKSYVLVSEAAPGVKQFPVALRRQNFKFSKMKEIMELQEDISISICGTSVLKGPGVIIINEKLQPPSPSSSPDGSDGVPQLRGIWIHPRLHQIPPNQGW